MRKFALKMVTVALIGLSVSFVSCGPVQDEYSPVTIPGSQVRSFQASAVDQEYRLHIYLPPGHRESNKKFPVLYLTDSDSFFAVVRTMVRSLIAQGSMPEIIIVGIGYHGPVQRPRDYLPVKSNKIPGSGGADNFIKFMRDELFPYVEANFAADPADRIFAGMSAGGTLGAYLLATSPELFARYMIVSPALHTGNEKIIDLARNLADTHDNLAARVYLAVGELEDDSQKTGYDGLVANLNNANLTGLSLTAEIIRGGTHMDAVYSAYVRGLKVLFAGDKAETNQAR